MDIFGIDINHIVELGTKVATTGALQLGDVSKGSVWDYIIGVAVVVYEMDPG